MENFEFELMVYEKVRKKNLSYKSVASDLGISKAYLSLIIRGKRKAPKIREKLMKILNEE